MVSKVKKHVQQVSREVEKGPSYFTRGFLQGIGWIFGATIGFALVIAIISFLLAKLGGVPVVGQVFANLLDAINRFSQTRQSLPR